MLEFELTSLSVFVPKYMRVFLESWFVKKLDFVGTKFHRKGKKWEQPTKCSQKHYNETSFQ